MKIGLGTVQFGLAYGVSNHSGITPLTETQKILDEAAQQNIHILDTAAGYGISEDVLGSLLNDNNSFQIVTKTPHFSGQAITREHGVLLTQAFNDSLGKLKQTSVYGLLVHNPQDLLKQDAAYLLDALLMLKTQQRVCKIGVSVYTAEQIERILQLFPIDLIQLPINVFDQRLLASGVLKKIKQHDIEVHARSIFLQGLLLMKAQDLHTYFDPIKSHIEKYQVDLQSYGISLLASALQFVKEIAFIDKIIVGVNNVTHLQEIITAYNTSPPKIEFSQYALDKSEFVNPSQWKLR